jgi:transposase InsO family protein
VAKAPGVSKTWVYELVARYKAEGSAGLMPRSRRPKHSPTKTSSGLEDEIISIRKALSEDGYDAGAETIRVHLRRAHPRARVPSTSTIWRILKARGFVTAEPRKRPKSSYVRFCAALPNECWQADITHVRLARGSEVEVLNIIDDHSRACVASVARRTFKSIDVVAAFHEAAATWGYPASFLSDNAAVFTAEPRNGVCVMESELARLGITFKHSRPYHPQTCGKVERFHQTLKRHLGARRPQRSIVTLQARLDGFVEYYNHVRPHRSLGRRTPLAAFKARAKARPIPSGLKVPPACRVRQDRVHSGKVTLRYRSRLYHVAVGREHEARRVILLVAERDVRIVGIGGDLIREFKLDPSRLYQPLGP